MSPAGDYVLTDDQLERGREALLDWQNAQPDEDDRLLAAISSYQRANEVPE